MILALLSYWRQPIEISRSTDRRQLGIMLPIGVMIKDPLGGGDASTLNGQDGAYYLSRVNHTGTQDASTIAGLATVATSGSYNDLSNKPTISTDAQTLNGQNGTYYLDRANHTGTQAISTVSGLEEALDNLSEADSDLGGQIVAIQNTLPLKADLVGGVIPSSQIPAIAITEYLGIAADQAEMLALVGQIGDWCHRTDLEKAFIIIGEDTTDPASWKEWPMPISAVTSVNGQVGVVVLNAANIGINSSDDIPEGSSNLYFTNQRVRDTTITGFTATNSPIISTDNVVQAFGKAQGQIDGLAEVATSGSYLDLLNRPDIDESKSLVAFSASNKAITSNVNATIYSSDKTAFDADVTLATTLYTTYVCEIDLLLDFPTGQSNAVGVMAFINGAIIPLSAEMQMGVSGVNYAHIYKVRLEIARYSGSRLGVSGFGHGINGALFTYTNASSFYGIATFNVCLRFTGTPQTNNKIIVKSARLYKLNNAS